MKKTVLGMILLMLACGVLAAFETTRSLSLPAEGVKELEIRAGAGSLTVTGREGLAAIEVQAEIVARHVRDGDKDDFMKERIELTLERRGDRAVLVGRVRERLSLFRWNDDAVINLTISVPKSLLLDIDDGSGSIDAADVAGVRIEDGSGSIRVGRIGGDVTIDDGSGEIEIDDITGNVTVDDGSGGILIRRVGGTVTVDDGSGGIEIDDVARDVRLIDTGSGDVDVSAVKGRVIRSA